MTREKRGLRHDYSARACCGSELPLTAMKHEKIEGNSRGCNLSGEERVDDNGPAVISR